MNHREFTAFENSHFFSVWHGRSRGEIHLPAFAFLHKLRTRVCHPAVRFLFHQMTKGSSMGILRLRNRWSRRIILRRSVSLLFLAGLLAILPSRNVARAQSTGASLVGEVHDAGGQAISTATVTAINTATNARTVQKTNDKGE